PMVRYAGLRRAVRRRALPSRWRACRGGAPEPAAAARDREDDVDARSSRLSAAGTNPRAREAGDVRHVLRFGRERVPAGARQPVVPPPFALVRRMLAQLFDPAPIAELLQ